MNLRWVLFAAALAACDVGGAAGVDAPIGAADASADADPAAPDAPRVDPLAGATAATLLQGGFQFTEGPQWRDATHDWLFTDINAATVYRYAGGATVFRMPSQNANGLALDPGGELITCEHGGRRVARGSTATPTTIADSFEGKKLNSPNDVVVRSDGTIYFTDPPYGIADNQRELDFIGVFRIAPGGQLTAERRGALTEKPNGLALSPDEHTLYVADTDAGLVRQMSVAADGSLGAATDFVHTSVGPDGLAVDAMGNLFVATNAGIEVFGPDGHRFGLVSTNLAAANVAFGGDDHRTLLVTARTELYTFTVANPGLPTH